MEIFNQQYLGTVKNTGAELHLVLKLVKELAHKCSQLERKIDDLKENRDSNLN